MENKKVNVHTMQTLTFIYIRVNIENKSFEDNRITELEQS